jgi:hypothetical protein
VLEEKTRGNLTDAGAAIHAIFTPGPKTQLRRRVGFAITSAAPSFPYSVMNTIAIYANTDKEQALVLVITGAAFSANAGCAVYNIQYASQ